MSGLVEEIQKDALNPNVPVSTILRKVKAAATKLKLEQVEQWVELELNGYYDADIPKYRLLFGSPQAFNPYNGWIPILMKTDRDNELLSRCEIRQPLVSLEGLVGDRKGDHLEVPLGGVDGFPHEDRRGFL